MIAFDPDQINNYAKHFVQEHKAWLYRAHYQLHRDNSSLGLLALTQQVQDELVKACHSFVRLQHDPKFIHPYLCSTIRYFLSQQKSELVNNFNEIASDTSQLAIAAETHSYLDIERTLDVLKECIDTQLQALPYRGNQNTLFIKTSVYQAFQRQLEKHPSDMYAYLILRDKGIGMQHRLFQELVSVVEERLPAQLQSNHLAISLLDTALGIFDGVSIFDARINQRSEIDNQTKEHYIGGRKGFYCKPFFLGKVIEIWDIENDRSLMDKMLNHSFFTIYLQDVTPQIPVRVTHYRITPHYCMGAMSHLNRIRKAIVDRMQKLLKAE